MIPKVKVNKMVVDRVWQIYDRPTKRGLRLMRRWLAKYNMKLVYKRGSRRVLLSILDETKLVPSNWNMIADIFWCELDARELWPEGSVWLKK